MSFSFLSQKITWRLGVLALRFLNEGFSAGLLGFSPKAMNSSEASPQTGKPKADTKSPRHQGTRRKAITRHSEKQERVQSGCFCGEVQNRMAMSGGKIPSKGLSFGEDALPFSLVGPFSTETYGTRGGEGIVPARRSAAFRHAGVRLRFCPDSVGMVTFSAFQNPAAAESRERDFAPQRK